MFYEMFPKFCLGEGVGVLPAFKIDESNFKSESTLAGGEVNPQNTVTEQMVPITLFGEYTVFVNSSRFTGCYN